MTLGVIASGCADPEEDYKEYLDLVTTRENQRPPASDSCLGVATSEPVDVSGTFAIYCRVNFAAANQALRLAGQLTQTGDSLSVRLTPLKIGALSVNDTIGDPDVTGTSTISSGKFSFDVGTVKVSGAANPISGSDIQLDNASFTGLIISADELRADLDGALVKPFTLDLNNKAKPDICVFYRVGADGLLPTPAPGDAELSCQPTDGAGGAAGSSG